MLETNINKESVGSIMLSTPKGMSDYLPEQQIVIEDIKKVVREIFERYGFVPLDTPGLENIDVLTSKGSGGEEIGKEIFTLKDRAGRRLGLRFDLTVPLARVFASNSNLNKPFKRYQEGKVWRQEFGTRTREFLQFDADTLGAKPGIADAEILAACQDIFNSLKIDVVIKVNNRKLLSDVIEKAGIEKAKVMDAIMCIDKLEKIGKKGVLKEAKIRGISEKIMSNVLKTLSGGLNCFKSYKGYDELLSIINYSKALGANVKFVPNLARGLDYYTGMVFEVFWKERPNKLSLAAGGRYDDLIARFSRKDEKVLAVGGSIGVTRIYEILKDKEGRKTNTKVFIAPIGTEEYCLKLATQLRKKGINSEIDLMERGLSANFRYADKKGILYSLVVGEKELKDKKFTLKSMKTGEQEKLTLKQIINKLNN